MNEWYKLLPIEDQINARKPNVNKVRKKNENCTGFLEGTAAYFKRCSSNLDSVAAVLLVTRHNGQRMNKVISRIKIDWTGISQAVQMKRNHTSKSGCLIMGRARWDLYKTG